jgi:hypothetical protein
MILYVSTGQLEKIRKVLELPKKMLKKVEEIFG